MKLKKEVKAFIKGLMIVIVIVAILSMLNKYDKAQYENCLKHHEKYICNQIYR